jgi:hypothetical protein
MSNPPTVYDRFIERERRRAARRAQGDFGPYDDAPVCARQPELTAQDVERLNALDDERDLMRERDRLP